MSRYRNLDNKLLLESFLLKIRSCNAPFDVLNVVKLAANQFGFDDLALANINKNQISVHGKKLPAWLTHYEEMGCLNIDAIVHAARYSTVPVEWVAQRPPTNIHPNQRKIFNEVYDLGFKGGVCYFSRKQNFNLVFGFYHQQSLSNLPTKENIADLLLVALYSHERLHALEALPAEEAKQNELSHREKVCLSLIKDGLNVSEAASVLKLADRTVTFHLQNCRAKLNAKTLPQAVAIALMRGLIEP